MLALPGILALIFFIYVRPQEVSPSLRTLPFLHLCLVIAVAGFAADVGLKKIKLKATPQFRWAVGFLVWTALIIFVKLPGAARMEQLVLMIISFTLFAIIAHSVQTFRAAAKVCATVASICLLLSFIGVHQSRAPLGCVEGTEGMSLHLGEGVPDGRSCIHIDDCYGEGATPDSRYLCERIGMLGTTTIQGRVRYRGVLQDPNELAMAICAGLPFLFALASRRRKYLWKLIMVGGSVLTAWCVIKTASRSGQLAFIGVLGVYFVKRYGTKGIAVGVLMTIPLLLAGGRGGAGADQSTIDRYEAWRAGMQMVRMSPVTGVGKEAFTDYHHLTAHNSYVQVAAEEGMVGFFVWSMLLLIGFKIALAAIGVAGEDEVALDARRWGTALLASLVGVCISMMFLSLTYHFVLWIYFGLVGGLYSAIKRQRPDFAIKIGIGDYAKVATANVAFLIAVEFILRYKGF